MRATARMRGWYRFIVLRIHVCVRVRERERERDRSRMAKGISTRPWCGSIAAKLEKNIRFLIETTLGENLPSAPLVTVLSLLQTALKPVSTLPPPDLFPPSGITIFRLSPRKRFLIARFNAFSPVSVKVGRDRVSFRFERKEKEGRTCCLFQLIFHKIINFQKRFISKFRYFRNKLYILSSHKRINYLVIFS